MNSTWPFSVNLKALLRRLLRICCRRCESVGIVSGRPGRSSIEKASLVASATWRKVRSSMGFSSASGQALMSRATVPDSSLDRSRMSLISLRRSVPDERMIVAYSICFGRRLPSGLAASSWARINRLLSGVRSSCDMLARNSDLYREVRASCSAFSSTSAFADSTSSLLCSTSAFCSAS